MIFLCKYIIVSCINYFKLLKRLEQVHKYMGKWYNESVFYQIYPLGMCGCPEYNDGTTEPRFRKMEKFIPHLEKMQISAVYFSPLFQSDRHGYDTRDYFTADCRLGSNEDLKYIFDLLHEHGIKVVLDGVFNHVGRGFWAFEDVRRNKWDSPYRDWFNISFDGNTEYNDGFWYEGWEGHNELVKLNLNNENVVKHLLDAVGMWIDDLGIDGIRLDVAYMLNEDFMRKLRSFCDSKKEDFFLVGEMIHGDYGRLLKDDMLNSVTNYECYKGLYSAFNSDNMFEICHSLARQFGPEPWTLYKGKHLLNFADNHDVTRIMSILNDKNKIYPLYGTLFAMPGIPCVYYGSEWGAEGEKKDGDAALRAAFDAPECNELTEFISRLTAVKRNSEALNYGSYRNVLLQNKYMIFERKTENERVLVAVNASSEEVVAHFNAECGRATDLITGELHDFGGGSHLPPYSVSYWKTE